MADLPTVRPPNHRLLGLVCAAIALAMVGAAYAAVPLYRVFCQVTGFDGTVRRGAEPSAGALARTVTVRFDTNVRGGLPWSFHAEKVSQDVRIGAPGMAWFKVRNDSDRPLTGRATYNVVPEAAGAYFIKTQCFCFNEQTIPAHTEMRFPVIYYVQPKFAEDRETRLFEEITLSYSFFPVEKPAAQAQKVTNLGPATAKPPEALGGSADRAL
jgi:cytochrome c oxidase assembly protein subunit 11